jgi:hypothetical protein
MTMSTRAALIAIGRQLDTDYLPSLAKPLPRELEDLLAQLVAYEFRKSGEKSDPARSCIPLSDQRDSGRYRAGR